MVDMVDNVINELKSPEGLCWVEGQVGLCWMYVREI